MKIFAKDMQFGKVGNFGFSGVRPEKLGATEYTLVTLVMDKTSSVNPFSDGLLEVKKAIIAACRKSPRAEYLMFRSVEFNREVEEVHGFIELAQIDPRNTSSLTVVGQPHCLRQPILRLLQPMNMQRVCQTTILV